MARAKQTVNKSPSLTLAVLALCYLTSSWCYSVSQALPADIDALQGSNLPQGPPVTFTDSTRKPGAAQPPSIEGIFDLTNIKSPAIPEDATVPRPPAIPHPSIVASFHKDPDAFKVQYNQWIRDNCPPAKPETNRRRRTSQPVNAAAAFVCPPAGATRADETGLDSDRERRDIKSGNAAITGRTAATSVVAAASMTYNQFVTAAVVTGLELRSGARHQPYTMFAPSDSYLQRHNLSLPILALRNMNCVRQIVRTHVVDGKRTLTARTEDIVLSLLESPIFVSSREANGVSIIRDNVETDYGVVHIIDGLIDGERLVQACPQLKALQPKTDVATQHNISLRKVPSDDQFLDLMEQEYSAQPLQSADSQPSRTETQLSDVSNDLPEADVPLELLANIDNFAHAMKLAWSESDSGVDGVIGVLQNLGASTFLALLERSHLMSTLAGQGPWTVFAPDNDAWQFLPKETFDFIMKDRVLLTEILSYHIVPMDMTRRQFVNDMMLPSLHANLPVHINLYTDGLASWYTASGSQILNLDETASNGVVHVVRSVLFPPHGDLNATVHSTPALRAATSLLQIADNSELFDGSTSLTAFLPMDSPLLNYTLSSLDTSTLQGLLERQVVRGTWFVSGLIDGDLLFTLGGEPLSVSHDGDCIGINDACIVVRDITLSNGVLHVVNKLF